MWVFSKSGIEKIDIQFEERLAIRKRQEGACSQFGKTNRGSCFSPGYEIWIPNNPDKRKSTNNLWPKRGPKNTKGRSDPAFAFLPELGRSGCPAFLFQKATKIFLCCHATFANVAVQQKKYCNGARLTERGGFP
jgi:hypothetical protein